MKRALLALAALPLLAAAPAEQKPALAPSEIVAEAPASDWVRIAPADLMVMELAPDTKGRGRRVVIELMPAPFSQGWVGNIRKLVAARWYDGLSVNRVQDNYVVQWGDAESGGSPPLETRDSEMIVAERLALFRKQNPRASKREIEKAKRGFRQAVMNEEIVAVTGGFASKAKKLPAGLATPSEAQYGVYMREMDDPLSLHLKSIADVIEASRGDADAKGRWSIHYWGRDAYARMTGHINGWPIAADSGSVLWPVHCYGTVGVGRGMSPDTGTGAELYTVIGHAPRHLDKNIALVGRVIEGIEHLSSLPRGTEALGFYKSAEERTPITSVRMGNEIKDLPAYEYLSTESGSFAAYADARANRRDAFFNVPAGGADVCNIPVPVRRAKG